MKCTFLGFSRVLHRVPAALTERAAALGICPETRPKPNFSLTSASIVPGGKWNLIPEAYKVD